MLASLSQRKENNFVFYEEAWRAFIFDFVTAKPCIFGFFPISQVELNKIWSNAPFVNVLWCFGFV